MQFKSVNPQWTQVGIGPWTGIDWQGEWISKRPLDPYLVWADATNQVDFATKSDELTPLLFEFVDDIEALQKFFDLPGLRLMIEEKKSVNRSIWPPVYFPWDLRKTPIGVRFITLLVSNDFFKFLESASQTGALWDTVRRFQIAKPILAIPVPLQPRPWPLDSGNAYEVSGATSARKDAQVTATPGNVAAGKRVVLGIIDDGLGFANSELRDRIEYFWDQDQNVNVGVRPPDAFNYGSEYGPIAGSQPKPSLLRAWMQGAGPGAPDEESVYATKAGLMQLRRRITHGSAVMDVAARDLADAALICVQLPTHTTQDTSGASLGSFVLDALHYILVRTRDLAQAQTPQGQTPVPIPIVVNLSYGDIAGPHDGSSMLEAGIDYFVEQCKTLSPPQTVGVVIPSGNSQLARCHVEFTLDQENLEKALSWRVHPDDKTPSFMEIWLPPGNDGSTVAVDVLAPGQTASQSVRKGQAWTWPNPNDPVCTIVFPALPANSAISGSGTPQRRMILVAVAPTASLEPRALAPAGVWKVVVRSEVAIAQAIDAWIQRDDSPYGYPKRGRQSYFEDPNYVRFNRDGKLCELDGDTAPPFEGEHSKAYVKRTGTMNGIATGLSTIVPAGYRKADLKAARYSSSGRSSGVPIRCPLMAQVSDDSQVHHGVLAGGTHSGTVTGFGGTSIAAPQVANRLASILSGQGVVAAQLQQFVGQNGAVTVQLSARQGSMQQAGATQVGPIDVLPPKTGQDERLGYGTIDPPPADRRGIAKT